MDETVTINWEVDDGYAGAARPQESEIPIDELVDQCETENDVRDFVDRWVFEDFRQNICADYADDEVDEVDKAIEAWKTARSSSGSNGEE